MNFLTIVLDSCRFDSFQRADAPRIRSRFDVVEGHAIATFTYPAHAAMFQGFFPNCLANRPLYNRFAGGRVDTGGHSLLISLYSRRGKAPDPLVTIPNGFRAAGYRTVAIGGVSWFRFDTPMSFGFEEFRFVPNAPEALDALTRSIGTDPFFALVNFGETHRPYDCPWTAGTKIESPLSGTGYQSSYTPALHEKQVRALEYLDSVLESLFDWLSRRQEPTLVCLCADHGETFGEDGCFGHGFYHPSVMTVPVAWSLFEGGTSVPVDWQIVEHLEKIACRPR